MRSKKAEDYWRQIGKDNAPLRINEIAFEGLKGIGKGKFSFSSSINVICGKNGLGKSTLLKSVYLTLSGNPRSLYPETVSRLEGSNFQVKFVRDGRVSEIHYPSSVNTAEVIYLDPSELCQVSLDTLRRERNLEEVIEQFEFSKIDDTSMREIRRILGREYQNIEVMEIEDLGTYEIVPFFRVTLNTLSYDSRDMALGEYSILYLWWLLWKGIETPHIVLIEEPENFLTPQAQRYLTDYLAFIALKSKLWILMSTHSEHVIENVGLNSTSVVVENEVDGSVIVKNPLHKLDFLEHLGLDPKKRGLILVEDNAGKVVFEQACLQFGSFLLNDYEVIKNDGSGPIRSILQNFPHTSQTLECIGIFDGDERQNINPDQLPRSYFLPGDSCPEDEFRSLIRKYPEDCAKAFDVSSDRLIQKLSLVTGQDHHDWLDNLRQRLGMDYFVFVRDLAKIWIRKNRKDFYELIASLDPLIPKEDSEQSDKSRESKRISGCIDSLIEHKGFGFITADDGETYFLHANNVKDRKFHLLTVSMRVSFEIIETNEKHNAAGSIQRE